MHITRKIASEEQEDERMADIEHPPLKIETFKKPYNHRSLFNTSLKAKNSEAMSIGDAVDDVSGHRPHRQHFMTIFNNRKQ